MEKIIILACILCLLSPTVANEDININDMQNQFGIKLFKKLSKENNLLISPLSINSSLTVILEGAEGKTYNLLLNNLYKEGIEIDEINKYYKRLNTKTDSLNSIWIDQNFPVNKEYINKMKNNFNTKVKNMDLHSVDAIKQINSWVKKESNGQINKIIDNISTENKMMIVNALYFKGQWEKEFNEEMTKKDIFNNYDGSKSEINMMYQCDNFPYYENEDIKMLKMNYQNEKSIYIILPLPDENINNIIDKITVNDFKKWKKNLSSKLETKVKFPRFKLDYQQNLDEVLKEVGLGHIYQNDANFNKINPFIKVGEISHRTIIEIDEKETRAGAVTGIKTELIASPDKQYKYNEFYVNRPFIFIISENTTNTIIFLAKIMTL